MRVSVDKRLNVRGRVEKAVASNVANDVSVERVDHRYRGL
jgi:hypothetical protein